jgi:acetoin utilization deacetylase AcuC-like enzyme
MSGSIIDVFWHEDALKHDPGSGVFGGEPSPLMDVDEPNIEGDERIRNMYSVLKRGPIKDHLRWHDGRYASKEEVLSFHDEAHFEELEKAEAEGGRRFSEGTVMAPGSFACILASAGTALSAMQHLLDGKGDISYALVRPPGHHSSPDQVDGYCFLNQVALCAELARAGGKARVATIDWDVHHGNGTQEGFYGRDDVLTISLHMDHGGPWGPQHPQTGKAHEVGRGAGVGYNVNVPLPMGTGDAGYEKAMTDIVMPAVDAFKPEALIIACGQDANAFDPNGRQCITMDGFHRLGQLARELAERHSGGQLCLIQEGGYQWSYAAMCLHATLEGVAGLDRLLDDGLAYYRLDPHQNDAAIPAILAEREAAIAAAA